MRKEEVSRYQSRRQGRGRHIQLIRISCGSLHARIRGQPTEHQVRYIPLMQLHIQIGALESTAIPVLANHHIAILRLRLQPLEELGAPAAFLEDVAVGLRLVDLGHVLPPVVVAGLVLLVHAIVDGNVVGARGVEELLDVGDGVFFFEGVGEEAVELALWVQEVVVGVCYYDRGVAAGGVLAHFGFGNVGSKGWDYGGSWRLSGMIIGKEVSEVVLGMGLWRML
jgi:hypothetical protein